MTGVSQRSLADEAMDRHASGDEGAFSDVYDEVAPRIYAYARRRTGDGAAAEDVVQRTLLSMHRARGTFIRGSPVVPWAFAIARRLMVDDHRKRRRDLLAGATELGEASAPRATGPQADEEILAVETAGVLQRELDRLPETQRVAFEYLRFDGLSHEQAAEALGATVSAVKLRAHRAYVALRAVLGAEAGDAPGSQRAPLATKG